MRLIHTGKITGRVSPTAYTLQLWAINGMDSIRTTMKDAVFVFQVKPGRYTVIAEAKAPYKNVVKNGVTIDKGSSIDLGEIKLEQ